MERTTSIDNMRQLVEEFTSSGEIENDRAARTLDMHLRSVGHYVDTGQTDKAIRHMTSVSPLLDHFEANGMITENAADTLREHADYLLEEWD